MIESTGDAVSLGLTDDNQQVANIKVIGVGGGGSNAIEHMINEKIKGVTFLCANTDLQALQRSKAHMNIQLGQEITKGLGAGANPDIGRQAACETQDQIKQAVAGADMLFITAGMGGGTGTGGAPVVAEIAREMGVLTVAVVTKPFVFEGKKRMDHAEVGIAELSKHVDSLIIIPNNKLLSVLGKSVTLLSAFRAANAVLQGAVEGIANLITHPGLINVDFADVRAKGEDRAKSAANLAVSSPLLDNIDLSGAKGVLVNITAGSDMSIGEFEVVGDTIRSFTSEHATVVVGTAIDPEMVDEMHVTVVVTGLDHSKQDASPTLPHAGQEKTTSQMRSNISNADSAEWRKFDRPAASRLKTVDTEKKKVTTAEREDDSQYLDIPAFLRKQEQED